MTAQKNNIGIKVQASKKTCTDLNCPFCGTIKVRGRQHIGTVISTKMKRSAVVEWERRRFVKKYERYERLFTKLIAHAPECLDIKEGDMVKVMECRPLSKTKHHIIIENLGAERGFAQRMEGRVSSKRDAGKEEMKDASAKESTESKKSKKKAE